MRRRSGRARSKRIAIRPCRSLFESEIASRGVLGVDIEIEPREVFIRRQHVEGFLARTREDDAVGTHAQRVLNEFALADFALAIDVGGRVSMRPTCGVLELCSAA